MSDLETARVSRWWHSFYFRLGASFVVFVVALILSQSVIFTYRFQRQNEGNPGRSPNNIAIGVAAELGAALETGGVDLDGFLESRYPRERWLYVLTKDGRLAATTTDPLREGIREAADMMLRGTAAMQPSEGPRVPGPVVFAPVQAFGALQAVVIMPPPPPPGVLLEAARFLSLPGLLSLIAATVAAAFVIFAPARRRLVSLEAAAVRLGKGDLAARATDSGRDEISQLARTFNWMGSELSARDEALRTSDRLRRQLLADVSHELKTPLTAMRGYLETLQMAGSELDAQERNRYLETVVGETRRLDRIVADLVNLARFENNIVTLETQVFATAVLLDRVVRRHELEARARGVRFTVDVEPSAEQMSGDPHRLEQVVENLVANAMRYVPEGGTIDLRARSEGSATVLTVADSGPGIAPEHVAHVFDRFYKADAARAAGGVGSGLGLSIVKAIVDAHGGRVGVTSRPGHTEFSVTVPHSAVSDD